MASGDANISGASITHQGYGRGPEDNSIDLFVFRTDLFETLFEAEFTFENGDDFRVVVRNFGLRNKSAVGSRTGLLLRQFLAVDIEQIRARIEEYFSNDEEKSYPPFSIRRARFVGVIFPDDWIVEEKQ